MKIKRTYLCFIIAVSAGISLIAAFPPSVEAFCPSLGGTVRVLMPDNFERFTYVSSFEGRRTEHRFGEQAMDELRARLSPLFSSVTVEHVASEAEAKRIVASGDFDMPDSPRYDLIAIPEFRNVNFWEKGQHYGFDVDMVVDFYTPNATKVTTIKGRGESRTGFYAASSPGESGSLAVSKAVEAVADGVCTEGSRIF